MNEMKRPRQDERRFAVDVGQCGIGGEPYDHVGAPKGHVVAADRLLRHRHAVARGRPHPDRDARQPRDRLDDPHELGRAEDAVVFAKPRREIGDPDRRALVVGQDRGDDRGIAHIFGRMLDHAVEHDVAKALLLVAGQEPRKDRIAVEARKAPPHDPRQRVDQRCRAPIADDRKIKSEIVHACSTIRGEVGEPLADILRPTEDTVDTGNVAADRIAEASKLRQDREHRLVGHVVADEQRCAVSRKAECA